MTTRTELLKNAGTTIKEVVEDMNDRLDRIENKRSGIELDEPQTKVNIDRKSREVWGMR